MILINKDSTSTLTLTLTEKCYLSNPYFLFSFFNSVTQETKNFLLTDTSQYTDRYNRFSFIEPTTADLIEGYWDYTVYEQASASNTDPTLAYGIVEIGKVKVVGTTPSATTYTGNDNTSIVYE